MAHVMKHTKASCGHMFAHFDRKAENISNENLDRTRTHLNYNLAVHQQMDQGEFVRKRCSEVRCQNRKDVNVMVSWVVTAPKDLPAQETRAFFQASYDFLQKRYGRENVVSSYVHMDEATPHMHFAFVPVKTGVKADKKNPDVSVPYSKVSAKEVITRRDLMTFHQDLSGYLAHRLGHEVGILNEATKEGNRSIEELKRQDATQRLMEADKKAAAIVSGAHTRVNVLREEEKSLRTQITNLQEQETVLQAQVNGFRKDLLTARQVEKVPHSKFLIGDKQIVDTADFNAICKAAAMTRSLLKEIVHAREITATADTILQRAKQEADAILKEANKEANSIKERMDSVQYRQKLEHLKSVINSSPELERAYRQAEQALQARQAAQRPVRRISHSDMER